MSFSWGESQGGVHAGGGGGAGKVSMQDIHFTMHLNKASPALALHCANGKHIPKALLSCRKAGEKQQDFYKVYLTDLLVSSYQTGGSASSDVVPVDQVSINFAKIEWEYAEQKPDGSLSASAKYGWDVKGNVKA